MPAMIKLSQKQYTFLMHLVDELGLFLNVLQRNKTQSHLIRQQLQKENSLSSLNLPSNETKITICLLCPVTLTLAVIDGLENAEINLAEQTPASLLPSAETEPAMRDKSDSNIVVDLIATNAPIVAGTAKIEPPASPFVNITDDGNVSNSNLNKGFNLITQKKTKVEETIQRGLEIASKGSRGSSQASLTAMSDNGDDSLSQWDQLSEEGEGDIDPALLNSEFEKQQQQEAVHLILDDDASSLSENNNSSKSVIDPTVLKPV